MDDPRRRRFARTAAALLTIGGATSLACGTDREWTSGIIRNPCGPDAWASDASAFAFHDHDRKEFVRVSRGKRVEVSDTACAREAASVFTLSPDGRYAVAWGERSNIDGDWSGRSGRHNVARCVIDFRRGEARPLGAAAESILTNERAKARLSSTGVLVAPVWNGIVFAHMDGGGATWVTLPPAGDPEAFVDPIKPWASCKHVSPIGNEAIAFCTVDEESPDLIGIARVQFAPPSVLQARVVKTPVPVRPNDLIDVAVSPDGTKIAVLSNGGPPRTLLRIVVDTGSVELVQPLEIEGNARAMTISRRGDALIASADHDADWPTRFLHIAPNGEVRGRSRSRESVDKIAWDGGPSFWISMCVAKRLPVP